MTLTERLVSWVTGVIVDSLFNYMFFWIPLVVLFALALAIGKWRERRAGRRPPN